MNAERKNTNDKNGEKKKKLHKDYFVALSNILVMRLKVALYRQLLDGSNYAVSLRVTSGTFFHLHDSQLTHLLFK